MPQMCKYANIFRVFPVCNALFVLIFLLAFLVICGCVPLLQFEFCHIPQHHALHERSSCWTPQCCSQFLRGRLKVSRWWLHCWTDMQKICWSNFNHWTMSYYWASFGFSLLRYIFGRCRGQPLYSINGSGCLQLVPNTVQVFHVCQVPYKHVSLTGLIDDLGTQKTVSTHSSLLLSFVESTYSHAETIYCCKTVLVLEMCSIL